jgi:4-cresol dehydrogenase (hydroxylating)
MDKIPLSNSYYDDFMKKLKKFLDPKDILAPGRYDFRHNWLDDKTEVKKP